MPKHTISVALILAACLPVCVLRGQEPAKKPAEEPLLNVAGQLTRDDPVYPALKKGFHKVYPVKLAADVYYQIDLVSADFDAYLRLEDERGKQVAEDDDSGGGQNARIVYKADSTSSHCVIVTTFDSGATGMFRLTVKRISQAAAEQHKREQAVQALLDEGVQQYHQNKLPQALVRFRKAIELGRQVYGADEFPNGHENLAKCVSKVAFVLWSSGYYGEAEPFHREALTMWRALYPRSQYPQGHVELARSLNNLGRLLHDQGEYGKAEPFYREALEMRRALFPKDEYPIGHEDLANSLDNWATLLQNQGEYYEAEPFFRQALAMRRDLYPSERFLRGHADLAASINNLGLLLQEKGEHGKAEPLYRETLAMLQKLYPKEDFPRGHPQLAGCFNNLGYLLQVQGEYGEATPYYRQAMEMLQALYPNGHPRLALYLNNLGGVLYLQGKYGEAEKFYRQALAMREALYSKDRYRQGHPDLVQSLNNLGGLLSDQRAYDQAEPICSQTLQMHTELATRLARVAPEAVALNAAAVFPLVRDSFVAVTKHIPGSEVRAYAAIWRTRAALTRVYQRRQLALIAAATDEPIRKAWADLQSLRRRREQLIMGPAPTNSAEHKAQLSELSRQIDTAERDLAPRLPALTHYEDLAQLGPDALQKRLPVDAVLIDFLRYTEFEQEPKQPGIQGRKGTVRYAAFVVSRQDIQRVELNTAKAIEQAVRQWRTAITTRPPVGNEAARKEHEVTLGRQADALRRLLWAPIERTLTSKATTVYLAGDGELMQLPWAALPGKGKDRVLLDDYALAVLPHGPFLLEQLAPPPPRSAKRPPAAEGLLLVGGIQYDDQPTVNPAASRSAEDVVAQKNVWTYLKGTDAERQLVATALEKGGPKLAADLSGRAAATDRLRLELERCRYAHIATHGFFADATFRSVLQLDPKLFDRSIFDGRIQLRIGAGARSPLVLSGLVCSGANLPKTPERGILSADAIAGLLLDDLHLAVLSACDTGIGDVAGGEGVFGLQRAFHIAGCKNVVASLWKVDDAATAALMVRFYGYLFAEEKATRLPPIEALRRAQLDIYRHPELIPAWARGEQRAPGPPRPATAPAPPDAPPELLTSDGRAPIRLWAAFTLSGAGR
jgi:CHAT domain-containing protein/Tfp pilus assembly protein PilF